MSTTSGVKCGECSLTVYPHEPNLNLDGRIFHRSCAKCKDCNKTLSLLDFGKSTDFIDESFLLCKQHYEGRFLRSGMNFKGKWQKSEAEGISLVIQKKRNLDSMEGELDTEATEDEPPLKKSPMPMLKSTTSSDSVANSPVPVLVLNGETHDVLDVVEVQTEQVLVVEDELVESQDDAADISMDPVAPRPDESLIADTEYSASPLNMTTRTVNSTEKTYFFDEPSEEESSIAEADSFDADLSHIQPESTEFLEVAEKPADGIENSLNQAGLTPIKQDVDDDAPEGSVRSRIKAMNKSTSKFMPTPLSMKKADAIDVQFFGTNRLTSSKKLGVLFKDEPADDA